MFGLNQKIAIIQCYIKIRKNVDVNIIIRNAADHFLVDKAFTIADKWLKEHNAVIKPL